MALKDEPDGVWIKSSACSADQPQCVEVARYGESIAVRRTGTMDAPLMFDTTEWEPFIDGVKAGEFDVAPG